MKLVMTLLLRDEEDIVAANIDFHLAQGVDFIVATDNLSVDRTPEILREYEKRGVLHYILQTDDDYSQHRWVTDMARLACEKFGADWIINNDADEFWLPQQGTLKQTLAAVDASCDAVAVQRTNFMPVQNNGGFFADSMIVRQRDSTNAMGNPLPGKVCHRAFADIEVEQGNHSVSRPGHDVAVGSAPITILHYPVRSYRQFANKIAKGGAAYARNSTLEKGIGETWRYLYELYQRDELESYYRSSIVDDAAIARGLNDGRLMFDDRLKIALSKLRR